MRPRWGLTGVGGSGETILLNPVGRLTRSRGRMKGDGALLLLLNWLPLTATQTSRTTTRNPSPHDFVSE